MARPEEPIDFILCEHFRHREMCNALDRLAEAPTADVKEVTALAEFIRSDLTMHIVDEEELFFPLLRRRCLPEDSIGAALERLDREHEEDRELSAEVRVVLLRAATESKTISEIPGAAAALRAFAQSQRRHMMLENAVLIPLARRRLTREDLDSLGKQLAARHKRPAPALSE
jgi:hemerythrin-like domain-containing protein